MKYAIIGWLGLFPVHVEYDTMTACRVAIVLYQVLPNLVDCYSVRLNEQYTLLPK